MGFQAPNINTLVVEHPKLERLIEIPEFKVLELIHIFRHSILEFPSRPPHSPSSSRNFPCVRIKHLSLTPQRSSQDSKDVTHSKMSLTCRQPAIITNEAIRNSHISISLAQQNEVVFIFALSKISYDEFFKVIYQRKK
jgi:hypothetical protein